MAVPHLYIWQDMRNKLKNKNIAADRKIKKNKTNISRFSIFVKYFRVFSAEHMYLSDNKLSDHFLGMS